MGNLKVYLRERFPLPLVLVLAMGYGLFIVGITTTSPLTKQYLLAGLCIVIAFIAFLLRQRVTDEFKDAKHDSENYPTRPFQRGSITKKQLLLLGGASLVLEVSAVISAGIFAGHPTSIFIYGLVLVYSFFMSTEFFTSKWLEKHFTLYFLSHQLIFAWLVLWVAAVFNTPITSHLLFLGLSFIAIMSSVEIIRKFEIRRDTKGKVVLDTYPSVWGRSVTVGILIALSALVAVVLYVVSGSIFAIIVSGIGIAAILLFRSSDILIRCTIALVFIGQGLGVLLS